MSLTIYYTSTRPVTLEEADAIRSAAGRANAGRAWRSSEPVAFFPGLHDGKLVGGSKRNVSPGPGDKDAPARLGLPDGTLIDVVTILAQLSATHAVDWELMHDFGAFGFIRAGAADPNALSQVEAFSGLGEALGELDEDGPA